MSPTGVVAYKTNVSALGKWKSMVAFLSAIVSWTWAVYYINHAMLKIGLRFCLTLVPIPPITYATVTELTARPASTGGRGARWRFHFLPNYLENGYYSGTTPSQRKAVYYIKRTLFYFIGALFLYILQIKLITPEKEKRESLITMYLDFYLSTYFHLKISSKRS